MLQNSKKESGEKRNNWIAIIEIWMYEVLNAKMDRVFCVCMEKSNWCCTLPLLLKWHKVIETGKHKLQFFRANKHPSELSDATVVLWNSYMRLIFFKHNMLPFHRKTSSKQYNKWFKTKNTPRTGIQWASCESRQYHPPREEALLFY